MFQGWLIWNQAFTPIQEDTMLNSLAVSLLPIPRGWDWMELWMHSHPGQSSAVVGSPAGLWIHVSPCICTVQYTQIFDRVVSVGFSEGNLHLGSGLSLCGSDDPLTGTMHCSAGQTCLQLCLSSLPGKVFIMLSCLADGIQDKCG